VRRARHRPGALLLAAFQIVAAASVPVADAMLEVDAMSEPIHIESARDASCGDGHDHVFCQLCRTLTVGAVPREPTRACHPPEQTSVLEQPLEGLADRSFVHSSGPVGPRAPPLA